MGNRFDNRVILVTGAGTGKGRATALRLAEEGASVVLWRRRGAPLEAVAGEIRQAGGTALVQPCDISNPQENSQDLEVAITDFGALDALFANAGHPGEFKPLWLLSEESAFVTGQEIVVDGGFTLGGASR